jgi:hypothetical protein
MQCCCVCREQILSRAQELTETNAKLDVLPMIPQDQKFDMSFWSAVLQKTEEDQWEYEGSNIPDRLTVGLLLTSADTRCPHVGLHAYVNINSCQVYKQRKLDRYLTRCCVA